MLKQLKFYYLFVSLPFVLLMLGVTFFFDAIKSTIIRNPHPQINYAIFVIILFGGVVILFNARRLIREAKALVEFSGAVHAKTALATLKKMANSYSCDIACLLQMVATSGDRSISHQEQAALEHELTNVNSRLNRRNSLPQYLTGLLVGMGLLGTFIGLLATLGDITDLISSFADLDMSSADPIVVFGNMIDRMRAPMQSMSIAFSASMFGLLGSIILGLMMVGIRRLQGDLVSTLSSEIARHIEIALSFESNAVRSGEVATGVMSAGGGVSTQILLRIEKRLAEASRLRQKALSAEIDDFKKQRADMLRTLTEQTEASNNFRSELQQFGGQLDTICNIMEKGNGELATQISTLTVHLAGDAKESHEQRAAMLRTLTEQTEASNNVRSVLPQLGGQLDTICNIVEKGNGEMAAQISALTVHLAGNAKESQEQRAEVSAQINELLVHTNAGSDKSHKQRAAMLRTLAEQTEASNNFRSELPQLGKQVGALANIIEKGNGEISTQIIELIVYMAGDAKESQEQRAEVSAQINKLRVQMNAGSEESHKLLAMLVDEQQGEKKPSVGGQKQ